MAPTPSRLVRDPLPASSRYECLLKIASGGMASVYVGRLRGHYGFSRLVAVKRAHAHFVEDDRFRRALIAEAQLASRIHHPNVVSVLDVDEPEDELFLVMDYVEGAALSQLIASEAMHPAVAVRVALDICAGLHAAHELTDESGRPLDIVHRDVSPQNVLVGLDGFSRIADFGVAKGIEKLDRTAPGLQGKFAYMAPEYIANREADRRADIFALGIVLWEALTGRRLFRGEDDLDSMRLVTDHEPHPASSVAASPIELDEVVARALAKTPAERYATAADLAEDLAAAAKRAGLEPAHALVGKTVRSLCGAALESRRASLQGVETASAAIGCGENEGSVRTADGLPQFDDARTLPLARREPSQDTTHGLVTHDPVKPTSTRGSRGLVAAVLAILVAAVWMASTHPPSITPGLIAATESHSLPLSYPRALASEAPTRTVEVEATSAAPPHEPLPRPRAGVRSLVRAAPPRASTLVVSAPPPADTPPEPPRPKWRRPDLGY